jgi:hypothetical protein
MVKIYEKLNEEYEITKAKYKKANTEKRHSTTIHYLDGKMEGLKIALDEIRKRIPEGSL